MGRNLGNNYSCSVKYLFPVPILCPAHFLLREVAFILRTLSASGAVISVCFRICVTCCNVALGDWATGLEN